MNDILLLSCSAICLAAYQVDKPGKHARELELPTPASIPAEAPTLTYDFKRKLQTCVGTICELGAPEKMKMSDYSASLMNGMGLSQSDTLTDARSKLTPFYAGMVSSSLAGTTDPGLKLLSAQLSPGTKKGLPEYDIVIRTKGMNNGALIHDWGARIRCAPVVVSTPWQKEPCP